MNFKFFSLRLEGEETLKWTVVSVGPCEEKFNIASNDHGRRQKCNFSVCLKGKTHLICRFSTRFWRFTSGL